MSSKEPTSLLIPTEPYQPVLLLILLMVWSLTRVPYRQLPVSIPQEATPKQARQLIPSRGHLYLQPQEQDLMLLIMQPSEEHWHWEETSLSIQTNSQSMQQTETLLLPEH